MSRTRLIIDLVLLLGIAAIVFYSKNYYLQFFRGPELVSTDEELMALASSAESEKRVILVELRNQVLLPTHREAVGTSNGAVYATNPYYLISIADRLLLVMTSQGATGRQLVGPLQRVTGPVDRQVWQAVHEQLGDDGPALLPVILNAAAAYYVIGYVGLAVIVPLTIFAVSDLARALRLGTKG